MNTEEFDAIVVGSGTSAYFAIMGLSKAGKKVAVVDEQDYGGTCALRGCQPKKYLVANAEAVAMTHHLAGLGIEAAATMNWQDLQEHKNKFLAGISEGEVEEFQEAGISTFFGTAHFVDNATITVGEKRITADYIVLATGSSPRRGQYAGADLAEDSTHFLNMPEMPSRVVFIGGGYISFEFAHVVAQSGSKATILHRSAQPLKAFENEIVDIVVEASRSEGIDIITDEEPVSIEKSGNGYLVKGKSGSVYKADLVIEATGRTPNLSVLDGGKSGVEENSKGVVVNEYLQSVSNPRVYAIGDCAGTPYQLAPIADHEGKVAAKNILEGNVETIDYSVVPSAVFTIPNMASVGLSEEDANSKGLSFRVNRGSTVGWPSSKRIGEGHSGYKVLISNDDNKILGAHIVRHNAPETINLFALAIRHEITAVQLAEMPWAYPTYTSDVKYMVR